MRSSSEQLRERNNVGTEGVDLQTIPTLVTPLQAPADYSAGRLAWL